MGMEKRRKKFVVFTYSNGLDIVLILPPRRKKLNENDARQKSCFVPKPKFGGISNANNPSALPSHFTR